MKREYSNPSSEVITIGATSLLAATNQIPETGEGQMKFNPDGVDTGAGGDGSDAGEAM